MIEDRRIWGKERLDQFTLSGTAGVAMIRKYISVDNENVGPYLRLMRADKPIGTWLLMIPCWWGVALASPSYPSLWLILLFSVGAFVMRGAGCVVNDIYDRKLDRLVERTRDRPLASGELQLWQALVFLGSLLAVGFVLLLFFNRLTVIVGALSLILVFLYPMMKRVTWWPQLFLGLTFNWGILMGGAAATGAFSVPLVLFYMGGIFWTLAYDTMYAHQDVSDDAVVGIKSTALLFGEQSIIWVAGFYVMALLLFAVGGWTASLSNLFQFGIAAAACFAVSQLIMWRPEDPQNCLKRFRSNREFALIIFAAILLGKFA